MTFRTLASDLLDAWHSGLPEARLEALCDRAAVAGEGWTQAQRVAWEALVAAAREGR